jgi:hypothetical protein
MRLLLINMHKLKTTLLWMFIVLAILTKIKRNRMTLKTCRLIIYAVCSSSWRKKTVHAITLQLARKLYQLSDIKKDPCLFGNMRLWLHSHCSLCLSLSLSLLFLFSLLSVFLIPLTILFSKRSTLLSNEATADVHVHLNCIKFHLAMVYFVTW